MSLHIKFAKIMVEMTKSKRFDKRCITVFNCFSRRYELYYKYCSTKFNINSTNFLVYFRQKYIVYRQSHAG